MTSFDDLTYLNDLYSPYSMDSSSLSSPPTSLLSADEYYAQPQPHNHHAGMINTTTSESPELTPLDVHSRKRCLSPSEEDEEDSFEATKRVKLSNDSQHASIPPVASLMDFTAVPYYQCYYPQYFSPFYPIEQNHDYACYATEPKLMSYQPMSPIIKTEGVDEYPEQADSRTPTPNPSPSPTTSCTSSSKVTTSVNKSSKSQKSASHSKRSRTRGRSIADDSEDRRYPCEETGCGKVFKRSEHLKRHHRSIHARDKPYRCPYQACSKRFSRSDNLNQHMRVHRDSKARSESYRS